MLEANYLLAVFVAIYVFQVLFSIWLERINLKHLARHGNRVPEIFEGFVDAARLSEMNAYTREKIRLGLIETLCSETTLLLLILSGFLLSMQEAFFHWELPQAAAGPLFFLIPATILYLIDLPFSCYGTFVTEKKYGFTRTAKKMWFLDQLKTGIILIVLFSLLLISVLWMIRVAPSTWWLWAFLTVSLVQILLAGLYPVLIAPIFNKFEPLPDAELAETIKTLMAENGLRVKSILQMDAGKRSGHTNAYFTGMGRTKQIVLFDTLVASHSREEILAVLAHEAGHYRGKHIFKQILIFEILMFAGFYLTYLLMSRPVLYSAFGFHSSLPYAGLFITGILWQKAGFFLQPLSMALSRHFERQADDYAAHLLKSASPLSNALKRMAADNLLNLTPHPLYVRFHYSHPPLIERLTLLEEIDQELTRQQRPTGKD